METSAIAEFYQGRSIFVTGATGFMGKVLVEKLLRSCPAIDRLFILIRSLKGKSVESRLQELVNSQVFDNIKKQQPNVMNHITVLVGDLSLPGLGLSSSDLQLLIENVSVVFNLAANVRFDQDLRVAIQVNVKGSLELLEICRQMKRLEAFVHSSTAFNRWDTEIVKDEVHHPNIDPAKLIEFIDCLDDKTLKNITKQLMGSNPNAYTYTKLLAEQLLAKQCGSVPLVIIRPSIVTAAHKEPVPGWIDTVNGPTGSIVGIGKGYIRVLKIDKEMISDIIPVDFAMNLMIALGWSTAINKPARVIVYTTTTGSQNPLTWGLMSELVVDFWLTYPIKNMFWYPSLYTTTNETWLFINKVLFHFLPASCIDLFYILTGKRTKWVRLYKKAHRAFSFVEFFTTHQLFFLNKNANRLRNEMSSRDRALFYFDVREIEWKNYFENYIKGVRRFICHQRLETLPQSRATLNRLYLIRLILYVCFFVGIMLLFKNLVLPSFGLGIFVFLFEFLSYESGHQWIREP